MLPTFKPPQRWRCGNGIERGLADSRLSRWTAWNWNQPLVGVGQALRRYPARLERDPHFQFRRLAPAHGRPPGPARTRSNAAPSAGQSENPRHTVHAENHVAPKLSTEKLQYCGRSYRSTNRRPAAGAASETCKALSSPHDYSPGALLLESRSTWPCAPNLVRSARRGRMARFHLKGWRRSAPSGRTTKSASSRQVRSRAGCPMSWAGEIGSID